MNKIPAMIAHNRGATYSMAKLTSGVQLIQPKRFSLEGVRVDLRKLFAKLADAIASGIEAGAGKIDSIPKIISSLIGATEAFDKDTPVEHLAWNLVYRSRGRF
jgi:hypothetical protein